MKLDLFNDLCSKVKDSGFVQNFMEELSNYLENLNEKGSEQLDSRNNEIDKYREENCLYQVVDFAYDGVFLQNMNNNKVFKETNMPKELMNKIANDYILRYKNGTYIFEEKLTDDFFGNLTDINEK